MDVMIAAMGLTVGLSFFYLLFATAAEARSRAWRAAARAAGLDDVHVSTTLGVPSALSGSRGRLRVRFGRYQRGRHETGTRLVIEGLGHPAWSFAVRREGVGSAIEKALGETEIELGDRAFDAAAYVHGLPRVVHALLDATTRQLLGALLSGRIPAVEPTPGEVKARVSVSDGALRAELPEGTFRPGGGRLPGALVTLVEMAGRLTLPEDVPARLADNARRDPLSAVRLANLLTLTREYPEAEATDAALRSACGDPDEEVRLRAALALGEAGRAALLQLAEQGTGPRAARAVAALGEQLPRERAEAILDRSLRALAGADRPDEASGHRALAMALVEALGRRRGSDARAPLVRALAAADEQLSASAARALGATGDGSAEPPLIAALERDAPTVQIAAAQALGRIGTAAAVVPLRRMGGRRAFGRASRQAIAEIQSRLTGASPGQLALAGGESGQLSLAGAGIGDLSLTDGDAPVRSTAAAGSPRAAGGRDESEPPHSPERPTRKTRQAE